jgi:hypothetical protein
MCFLHHAKNAKVAGTAYKARIPNANIVPCTRLRPASIMWWMA